MFNLLDVQDAAKLEEPFLREEVLAALSDLKKDKAPRLDGFVTAFWQFSWDFVKEKVMAFFNCFHVQGRFVRNLNVTFLLLVPKKEGTKILMILGLLIWWVVFISY